VKKIKATGLATLFFLFYGFIQPISAQTFLEFRIPSGATSEASRLYVNFIDEFEHHNKNIKIKLLPYTNWDLVTTDVKRITGEGKSVGLFVSEVSTTQELEKAKAVISFERAIKLHGNGIFGEPKDFKDTFVSENMLDNSYGKDGKLYGPPFIRSIPIAFYNLDLLKKIEYSEENLPKTWHEMILLLEKYKAKTGYTPFGFGAVWYDYLFEATVRQAGGSLMTDNYSRFTLDSPEAVEALEFWAYLQDNDLMRKTNNWKSTINSFAFGIYPVVYYSSGGLGTVSELAKFKWKAEVMPKNKVHGVSFGGGNLYISSHMSDDETRAALRFAHFLYSEKVQTEISEKTGFFPVTKAAFTSIRNPHLNTLKQQFRDNQVYGKIMTEEYLKTRNILKEAIEKSLYKGISPRKALEWAQSEAEKLLMKK